MHDAGNQRIGDTGVEAVVRMAATTPALKRLDLGGTCVRVGCLLWSAAVFMSVLYVCFRTRHQNAA